MPYDSIISRSDAAANIPEDVAALITRGVGEQSAAMALFRRVTMSRKQTRIPVLSALPVAYFVDGDTGLKQTTEMAWANKYLNAEEIAAIVPIPEAVLDDAGFDIWGEVRPRLEEAIARAIDAAVFFGTNKPASWPDDLATAIVAASNTVVRGTATAAQGGIAGDISAAFALVEEDGFDVSGFVARRTYRGLLRNLRDSTGVRLDEVSPDSAYGIDIGYPMRGLWPTAASSVEAFVGDRTQAMFGVRQDITYKVLDQAVIQDGSGAIVYNLAQQDMVALRVVTRVAWQVANILNYDSGANGFPFAAIISPA